MRATHASGRSPPVGRRAGLRLWASHRSKTEVGLLHGLCAGGDDSGFLLGDPLVRGTREESIVNELAEIEVEAEESEEGARVYAWRVKQLSGLGLSHVIASAVASFVDWHEIAGLVERAARPSWRSKSCAERRRLTPQPGACCAGWSPARPSPPTVLHTPGMATEAAGLSGRRVVVADDDVLLREGLASLLERAGYQLVGQAGDGSELLRLVREQRPDLVIVDIRMPPTRSMEGLETAAVIREEFPGTAILILSAHVEIAHAMTLLASGSSSGYLLKSRVTDIDEFLDTLERVCRGGSVVDPSLVQQLVAAQRVDDPLEPLTPREREVLALMAEGRSNAGISRRLWVTEGTVENHVHNIMAKLRLQETDDDHRRVLAVITFLRPSLHDPDRAG
jgi:DNA-binding NarL/FixJ family response regulator